MSDRRLRGVSGDMTPIQTLLFALTSGILAAIFTSFLIINSNGFNTHVANFPPPTPLDDFVMPTSAFGSVLTESYSPIFQTDAVYGITEGQSYTTNSGSGTVYANNSAFCLETGTTQYSYAAFQSRKRLRYRSGQGSRLLFTTRFVDPVPGSMSVAGLGTSTDGVFFGYDINGVYGILHSNRGVREIQELEITTASTTNENVVVTLNGVSFNVPVTNSGSIQRTVWEIGTFDYHTWTTQTEGTRIIFVRGEAGATMFPSSLSGTTANGTFSTLIIGALSETTWVPQSEWNGDKMDGTGSSGVTIDPSKLNVYGISMQYLGAGAIRFFIEGQDTSFILVHTLRFPNHRTETTFGIPSFPFTAAVYSAGSTTNLAQHIGSYAGFIEGQRAFTGDRFAISNVLISTVDNSAYYVLFTLQNSVFYKGKASQGIINVMSIGGASQSNGSITLYLFRSFAGEKHDLQGDPSFSPYAPNSALLIDTGATTLTVTNPAHLIWSVDVASLSSADTIFGSSTFEELSLQPGEYISLCARTTAGTADYVTASMGVRQDY